MRISLPFLMLFLVINGTVISGNSIALTEDNCTNNAIPRSTPSSDFVVLGDGGVVRHEPTGLQWQRCAIGQDWTGSTCAGEVLLFNWQGALVVADSAGGDWRLPNIKELNSIIEECRHDPAINRIVFPNSTSGEFWSATPAVVPDRAWSVTFNDGVDIVWINKIVPQGVRLVRDEQ